MNRPATPEDVVNIFDLGFMGVKKDHPNQTSKLPIGRANKSPLNSRGKRV